MGALSILAEGGAVRNRGAGGVGIAGVEALGCIVELDPRSKLHGLLVGRWGDGGGILLVVVFSWRVGGGAWGVGGGVKEAKVECREWGGGVRWSNPGFEISDCRANAPRDPGRRLTLRTRRGACV